MQAELSRTIAAIVAFCAVSVAQVTSEKLPSNGAPPPVSTKLVQPLPFQPGERLIYDVSFSKLIFSGTLGEVTLSVSQPAGPASKMLELKAEAASRGLFPALLGIKVKDTYLSTVGGLDFELQSYKRSIEEGKTRREQTAIIHRETGKVSYTDRDLSSPKATPKVKEASSPPWIQDVLSAIYLVRALTLKEGEVIPIPISDSGAVYTVEAVVGKREEVKVALGTFKTIQLDAKVFDGRFIKRSGEMLVWISDDPQRVIVRVRVKTSGATVTAELKRITSTGTGPARVRPR
ncbi:MAG TPA: DUF3108 domain-containing protein [Blastocatellia bacterium]|nr:DUF3108 domain-containing protein [Blastocatellia bacterium]